MSITGYALLTLGLACIVILVGVLFFFPIPRSGFSEHEMQEKIAASLPAGSSKDDVIKFLQRNNVETDDWAYVKAQNEIVAGIHNTCYSLLMECSLGLTFKFDSQGRMIDATVHQGLTGL